jgi:hypothetical protein
LHLAQKAFGGELKSATPGQAISAFLMHIADDLDMKSGVLICSNITQVSTTTE